MTSCIYEGRIRHRRFTPVSHPFEYSVFLMYLDLGEIDRVFDGRWLWSASRPAPAWFRRADHYGDPGRPLHEEIRDLVRRESDSRPRGPIRLLTHLRYFGYCMNPVSFYYCFAEDGETLEAIVAEVNNTPWGERHCYVLAAPSSQVEAPRHRWVFPKQFHVSPFMPMDQTYDWRFTTPGSALTVHMDNVENGRKIFDATMTLERRPITAFHLARVLLSYPLMTVRVISAIYWQAFRLWLKRCRYYDHPENRERVSARGGLR